jgi:site-specific recombinase XerD
MTLFPCSHERAKDAIIYSYKRNINGFAAHLEEEEAAEIASKNKENIYSYITSTFMIGNNSRW